VSIQQDVTFAPQSDLPAVHACVDVLLLIGRAMQLHFPDLLRGQEALPPAWDDVLGVLSGILFREMRAKHITDITHAVDIWNEFAASRTVRLLGKTGSKAIHDAGQKIMEDAVAANAGIGPTILWEANQRAMGWITAQIVPHLGDIAFGIAPLVIDYDETGKQFCASSSPLLWEIHWTLQPVEHSLFGAMVLSRVLEHEYFSHLMPRNQHLSQGVREVLLVETLQEEHRNDDQGDPGKEAETQLTDWFRILLEQHFYRNGQASRAEMRNFETLALRLRRKSETAFWAMTSEIVRRAGGEADATVMDRVLKLLRRSPDGMVDQLAIPWPGFGNCLDRARRMLRK